MAHNIFEKDNILCVGDRPWHGLGTTLSEPPESATLALQLGKLDWTVRKRPMFLDDDTPVVVAGSVSRTNDGVPGAIFREDTKEILGVVGPAYVPFQNSEMAALFDPLVADGTVTVETVGSLFNGRRVWMLGKFGETEQIQGDDRVAKYLLLAHGHDGQFAVRFGFTPIRVVCWNTLSAATDKKSGSKLIRCLHTSGLESNLETLRNALCEAEEVFSLTAEQYRQLAKRGCSRADLREYARIVLELPVIEKDWSTPAREKMAAIVENALHREGNKGQTWWDAYNGVTEYVCWQSGKSSDRRLSEAWWGGGREMSERALNTAMYMSGVA